MVELIFVRHGESKYNRDNIIQGQVDSELTRKGVRQAEILRESISEIGFETIYSSDLERAKRTADIVSKGRECNVNITENLRERHLGVLHGEESSEWKNIDTEDHQDWKPENGESLKDHKNRVGNFLSHLEKEGDQTILAVAHGGSVRAALMFILGCKSRRDWRIEIDNCSITRLYYEEERWKIIEVNNTSHMG